MSFFSFGKGRENAGAAVERKGELEKGSKEEQKETKGVREKATVKDAGAKDVGGKDAGVKDVGGKDAGANPERSLAERFAQKQRLNAKEKLLEKSMEKEKENARGYTAITSRGRAMADTPVKTGAKSPEATLVAKGEVTPSKTTPPEKGFSWFRKAKAPARGPTSSEGTVPTSPSPGPAATKAETLAQEKPLGGQSPSQPAAHPVQPSQRAPRRQPFWKQQKSRKKQKMKRNTRRNLESYLQKAGYYETSVERIRKRIFLGVLGLTGVVWLVVLLLGIMNRKSATDILLFSLGLWTAVFAFFWLLVWGIIYFTLEMRIYRRTKELEEVLPDFLQLTSANISAGMPIDRALWLAIRPSFGVLAKEIEDVAKATLTGQDLGDALRDLTKRYDSVILKRSVAIILEGLDAGGELADLLNKVALNIQELKIMKKEMAANVTTYAIFISFASIVIAPILFALASQLIVIVMGITAKLDMTSLSGSFLSLSPSVNANVIRDFRIYCVAMLSVSALMAASIIAVIRRGRVKEGITNIPVYILVSLFIYFLASSVLGSLLGGIM